MKKWKEFEVAKLTGEFHTYLPVTGGEVVVIANAVNINAVILEKLIKRVEALEQKEEVNTRKEPDDTLTYYTTRCTSCGKVSPIGNYCIWCGEKDTCLEGGAEE